MTSGQPQNSHAGRGPGRPLDPAKRQQVLDAAVELLGEKTWPITVQRLVERSGVTRAAIYRSWNSVDAVLADALDVGRVPTEIRDDISLYDAIIDIYMGDRSTEGKAGRRFRRRLQIGLGDSGLQEQYWRHVNSRRVPVANALLRGVEEGTLRADLNIDAAIDLLSGFTYYQVVARGASTEELDVRARLRDALDIVWRGMEPDDA